MDKDRILVIEDDHQTSTYLKTYFDWLGYEVFITPAGSQALASCRLNIPSVVILDVTLPDLNGFEVCRTLRNNSRTSDIPIIFLSQRSKRNDIIAAFEIGADDYITKPFDIEELKLRVESAIRRTRPDNIVHPVTNLPAGDLIIEKLRKIKDSPEPWTLLYFGLADRDSFGTNLYNKNAIHLANLLRHTVDIHGSQTDFLGQASDESFIVITIPELGSAICQEVTTQFKAKFSGKNGAIQKSRSGPLIVGAVSSYDGPFTDVKQIAKRLAQFRFKPNKSGCPDETFDLPPGPEDVDYRNQLAEQVALWQASPQLAQALLEVGHLVAARVPALNKAGVLLEASAASELPAPALARVQNQQQLCCLATENLIGLAYEIRSYRAFEPTPLAKTVAYVLSLLKNPHISFAIEAETDPETFVAIPALELQQVIFNLCRWLLSDAQESKLDISFELAHEAALLRFVPTNSEPPYRVITLLQDLDENKPGAAYGYLVQKIASRYGGQLTSAEGVVTLSLPLSGLTRANPAQVDAEDLRQTIKQQRLFLEGQKHLTYPPHILDKATDLIDPLAEDLLAEIEAMLNLLNSTPELDHKSYPWTALERNYGFFRLSALDLRKHRPLIPAPVNLASLLEGIEPMLAPRLLHHKIVIQSTVDKPVVNTDRIRLTQIFVNLALNGLEAMPEGGMLTFLIKQTGQHFVVEVTDEGSGISLEDQRRIFDPYFSTKGEGRGTGLHHVKTYIRQLNGQIQVFSRSSAGTTISVTLPPAWEAGYF
jgi:signal transduction histidine kinase/CheY-like chemotaxis protein